MLSPRTRLSLALAGAASLIGAFAAPALAGDPGIPGPPVAPATLSPPAKVGTLSAANPLLHFKGAVNNPTPLPLVDDPSPEVCAFECEEYQFSDAVPGHAFLVAIKGTVTGPGGSFNADDGFDLYVYNPAGSLVGSANGIGANGQSVLINPGQAGTYKVVVTITYAYDSNAGWVGEVRLIAPTTWKPAAPTCGITVSGVTGCFELPALRAVPAYDLTASGVPPVVSTPLGFPFPFNVPTPNSCYADETLGLDNPSPTAAEHPVTRCLRFTSDIQNVGGGELSVGIPAAVTGSNGQPQVGYVPGECQAVQFVTDTNGATVTRPAGTCEFHLEHGHFHYGNLLGYTLHTVGPNGSIGPAVSTSIKESFCLTDDDYFGYGTTGPNGPRLNVGQPDCNIPRQVAAPSTKPGSGTYVVEGITPGWGDVYTWDTPDQYIDVTNIPSGTYWIVEETNPAGVVLVAGPAHTCAATELQLTRGAQSDTVKQLQTVPSVTCPTS
jgi:hypothetical protein